MGDLHFAGSAMEGLHLGCGRVGYITPPPSDTTGYDQQVGSMHPTGMHSC